MKPPVVIARLLLAGILMQLLQSSASATVEDTGLALFTRHCSVCHNNNGIGGIGLPIVGEKLRYFSRSYLAATIRHGRPGRVMPAFAQLAEHEVVAIVDYLETLSPEGLSDQYPDTPVVGDAQRGRELFSASCANCHGSQGQSQGTGTGVTISRERSFEVVPPALNNPGFLASANDNWIRQTIVLGREGTIMPSQAELGLTDRDVNDIVAFVRSLESNPNPMQAVEPDEPPTLVFESPYDLSTSIENLKQSLKGANYRYFPDRLLEQGLDERKHLDDRLVSVRFCNFKQLYKLLNIEPRLGVALPCRITVVEGNDGQVRFYLMNMTLIARLFNNEQLHAVAGEVQAAVLEAIDEATL